MSNTDAKKRYAQTATRINQAKLHSGEYAQILIKGKAEDVAVVQAAIDVAGGSRVQALAKVCREWLAARNDG